MEEISRSDREALHELILKYEDIIGTMPEDVFTSHQFILELARKNQGLYIRALNRYADSATPFRTMHSLLAQALKEFGGEVERIAEEVPSEDIFRQRRRCSVWRKKSSISPESD